MLTRSHGTVKTSHPRTSTVGNVQDFDLNFARIPVGLKQSVSKRLIMSWTNFTSSRQYLNTCPDKSGDQASLLHYFSHPIPSLYRFVTDDSAILRTA